MSNILKRTNNIKSDKRSKTRKILKIYKKISRIRMEKPKSGMYVPLLYSNLYKAVPKGEDILYSLFYKAFLRRLNRSDKTWYTHILVTTNGFYFGWYQEKDQLKVIYVRWSIVKKINKRKIKIKSIHPVLKPKRERNFETWRSFRNRKREFSANIQNIMHPEKKRNVNESKQLEKLLNFFDDKHPSDDKYEEVYDYTLDRMKKKVSAHDPYERRTSYDYVDMRKKKMPIQHSILVYISLFVATIACFTFLFLSLFIYRSWDLIIKVGSLIFMLFFIVIAGSFRSWICKQNFEILFSRIFP